MDAANTIENAEALDFAEILRECLTCGVIVLDTNLHVSAFNAPAENMIGLKASSILHQPIERLPEGLRVMIQESAAAKVPISGRTLILPQPNSPPSALQVSSTPVLNEAGALEGLAIVLNELSAAQKLGWNMQRLDRLASIGTLSASMAHEIKNALVAVATFIDDLLQKNKDAELAGLVRREIRRVDSIVSQMLKFAGPAKPTFSPLRLHRVLDQSLRLIHPQLDSKQIRLCRSFAAQPDVIVGDGYQLEQVFINILLNAVAAMDSHGQLSVSTMTTPMAPGAAAGPNSEPTLQVVVSDTGAGIPAENLSRLFEPFFTTKPHGSGLGLAISRRIILEHHAKIGVESELGKGTTFRLSFPIVKAGT